jgi:type II secretory pathway pseudopilin PulG
MKKQSTIRNPLVRAEPAVARQSAIRQRAFTIIELLVVISTIALVLAITMPGIIGLFTAGADLQSRNVISGMLSAARAVAIENQSYAGVHVQNDTDGKCWAAVMQYDNDPTSTSFGKFVPVSGFKPQSMPGDMAFGGISDDYVLGSNYTTDVNTDMEGFTTFNVIFSPDGSLFTGKINGFTPQIETDVKIFGGDSATAKQQIWNHPGSLPDAGPTLDEAGVRAITAFHYKALKILPDKQGWLDKNGQFLCINPYTGKLLPDEQE